MARTPIPAARILAVSAALAAQSPRFVRTKQDLFAGGSAFVKAWVHYDGTAIWIVRRL
jgi:hypothetical protein